MKRFFAASILIMSSILSIPSSTALITCPTGSVISATDSTKCIKSINLVDPLTIIQTSFCQDNASGIPAPVLIKRAVSLGGDYCQTPSYIVPAQNYPGTTIYITYCPTGFSEYDATTCFKSTPYTRTPLFSPGMCLSGWTKTSTNCTRFTTYLQTMSFTYESCPIGSSRSSDLCIYAETSLISYTSKVTGINGLVQCDGYTRFADVGCVNDAYTVQPLDSVASTTTTGTCPSYYVYDTSLSQCKAFIYDPIAVVSSVIYKCTETRQGQITSISYYNSDATVIGANGVGRSCVIYTDVNPTSSEEGLYFCTITQFESGFKYYFQSTLDASGSSAVSSTDCDFVYTIEESILPDDEEPSFILQDSCAVITDYREYLSCLRLQYV